MRWALSARQAARSLPEGSRLLANPVGTGINGGVREAQVQHHDRGGTEKMSESEQQADIDHTKYRSAMKSRA